MKPVGETIRQLRVKNGWTQEDLAAKAGVSVSTVQRAERGGRISADKLTSIASAFQIDVAELIGEVDARTTAEKPTGAYLPVSCVASGKALLDLLGEASVIDFLYEETEDIQVGDLLGAFYDYCLENLGDAVPVHPGQRIRRDIDASRQVRMLERAGLALVGATYSRTRYDIMDEGDGMPMVLGEWQEVCCVLHVATSGHGLDRITLDWLDVPDYTNVNGLSIVRLELEGDDAPPF